MARPATKRVHVAVFVSSTFTDMQIYRRKVQDALTQIEAIVRGMEQFGSKPGSPVEECLRVVRSCKLYVGVFGMRYGSVPEGYDKSMTHLEYDEAQRIELPSLIYLLDENQPIPAKDVETGSGAEKLRELKEQLKKRHVVSFYSTAEDLQARILHDVPSLLQELGAEVTGHLTPADPTDDEMLAQFTKLPKLFKGRQVTIEFVMDSFSSASVGVCEPLDLEIGGTVRDYVKLKSGQSMYVYGENELALTLLRLPKKTVVRAKAVTAFGVSKDIQWGEDGPVTAKETIEGLVIKEILHTDREDS